MGFDKNKISALYPEAENLMIEPMLIWKLPQGKERMFSELCDSKEYFMQEKIDGSFYQFVKTENYSYLFGRTVSKTTGILTEKSNNVPHLKKAFEVLPKNTILIGEIYIPGGKSKDTVSIMGCLPNLAIKRQEKEPIHYYVHDIIFYDGVNLMNEGAESRYQILSKIWELHSLDKYDFLRLAKKVDTDIQKEISKILKAGGEGAVLKKKGYPYIPGKRPAWSTVKIKQMDTVDLVCIGFCNPTKEYTGKELETWEYWENNGVLVYGKQNINIPEMLDSETYGEYDDRTLQIIKNELESKKLIPVTKPYYLGWKTAFEIGAYDENGNIVKLGTVSSGLTDEMRQGMSEYPDDYLNKVVSLDCMSIDYKEHTLRHPVLKAWRSDKNPRECTIQNIFN